ncbi:GreA/GreB family elongation factor, partial [Klebsiella pneumoniae]|nr:GreA/GreB family elongation factor [Klebsiella pneumoniae]
FVEGQIQKLEKMVRYAKIIDPNEIDEGIVSLGRKVTFIELPDGDEEVYLIVGRAEADPLDGKISNESPIAQALIGKGVNDEVTIETPGGDMV